MGVLNWEEVERWLIHFRNVLLFSIVMGLISGFSFSHILDILGFGEKGIKAGTVAAAYQASKKSKVGRFSLFSYLQYVGAKRLPKLLMSVTLGLLTFCICFEVLLRKPPVQNIE